MYVEYVYLNICVCINVFPFVCCLCVFFFLLMTKVNHSLFHTRICFGVCVCVVCGLGGGGNNLQLEPLYDMS